MPKDKIEDITAILQNPDEVTPVAPKETLKKTSRKSSRLKAKSLTPTEASLELKQTQREKESEKPTEVKTAEIEIDSTQNEPKKKPVRKQRKSLKQTSELAQEGSETTEEHTPIPKPDEDKLLGEQKAKKKVSSRKPKATKDTLESETALLENTSLSLEEPITPRFRAKPSQDQSPEITSIIQQDKEVTFSGKEVSKRRRSKKNNLEETNSKESNADIEFSKENSTESIKKSKTKKNLVKTDLEHPPSSEDNLDLLELVDQNSELDNSLDLVWRPKGSSSPPKKDLKTNDPKSLKENKSSFRTPKTESRKNRDQKTFLPEEESEELNDITLTFRKLPAKASTHSPQKTQNLKNTQKPQRSNEKRVEKNIETAQRVTIDPFTTRQLLSVPEDAPQIVLRSGIPLIVRQGEVYPSLCFFGSATTEERVHTILEEIKLAADAGVHLFTHLLELVVDLSEVNHAVSFAFYLVKKTLEVDPKAQIIFRVCFTPPKNWDALFPQAKFKNGQGDLAEPSFCDDQYWSIAEKCLEALILEIRSTSFRDSILGLHLERGEWFHPEGAGYDYSQAAVKKFREWTALRYHNDVVALRAAWFDGKADFDTVQIPEYTKPLRSEEEFVRTGRKTRRWVDYHLFLSDEIVHRIGKLAYAAKKASEGYLLIGVSYGYTFEWSHPANGHLSLGKLLRTPEVDFIAGPPSYKNREAGKSAPFPCPIDSFALSNKLYLSEEDYKTPITKKSEPDSFNPVIRTPQLLESVHYRGAGVALAHSTAICWMDLWGNGWLNSAGIWERASLIKKAFLLRMATPPTDPDMAVFIDERSLAYLVDQKAFSLLVQKVRETVFFSGMSVGFYLLSDLAHRENFPESKLYVFLNAWDIRPEVRRAIKSRIQKDGKVLFWLYCAGLFEGGRESLERSREATGIAIKKQPFAYKAGTTLLQKKHPLCQAMPESEMAASMGLEPSYFAIPDDETVVLGEYSQTGLPSFVLKNIESEGPEQKNWTSIFLGEPIVTPALLRAMGEMAGAHIWSYQDDIVHARPPFLAIHATSGGIKRITLPNNWRAYNLITQKWEITESTRLTFQAKEGSTSIFLVGTKDELETLLDTDHSHLLKIDKIPPRPENTLELDSINFDVPIIRPDQEHLEELDQETEEVLFKMPAFDQEAPKSTEDQLNHKPHHNKSSWKKSNTQRTKTQRKTETYHDENDDLNMNIVFRKREE